MKSETPKKEGEAGVGPYAWKDLLVDAENTLRLADDDFRVMCIWLAARTPVCLRVPENYDLDALTKNLSKSLKSKTALLPIVPEDQYWRSLLRLLTKCDQSPQLRHLAIVTDLEKHSAFETNHVRSILDLAGSDELPMTVPVSCLADFPQFAGTVRKCPESFRCAVLVAGSQQWYPGTHIMPNGTVPGRCEEIRMGEQR